MPVQTIDRALEISVAQALVAKANAAKALQSIERELGPAEKVATATAAAAKAAQDAAAEAKAAMTPLAAASPRPRQRRPIW